ncbi:lipopolysaccharide biosynthesis protein [Neobacillus bataviensis LMG 21833]|uniref:Lipopolysaccharide biosynthesis protein n=1 Tax=Neobacillus bataviensis LMG 21833 TaxID=1117379 RepID=K6DZY7_9BACI|nr:Wzz/FepE/Etk N-terminal domain-containing protein [Neobacillus bataviensis]EKN66461.1 lipopolysaccharide biosynthesis protein [Neobacillus bataviensis LMG 21833]
MEETISLKELFETLKKRLLLIVSITLIAAIVSGVVSFFFLTPIYQASTQILVNQKKSDQSMYSPGDVQTNLQLISTYNAIITSPRILDIVAENPDINMTVAQLKSKITVGSEKDSQVVNLSVQDPNAKMAAKIANETAEVFKDEIPKIMNTNVENVSILAKADVSENPAPIKPRPLLNVAIAIVVGLMAGVGLAFLLEYFNNTIKNEQDVEKLLGLPILGVIATIEDQKLEDIKARRAARNTKVRGETLGS